MEQEDAPLLGSRPSTAADHHVTQRPQLVPNSWSGFSPSFKYCIGLELLCELVMIILTVFVVSAVEYAICARHHHGGVLIPELCKAHSIWRNLAEIRGWTASFETFSAIIVSLPIGRIANHQGQRVFMVVVVGILTSLTWTLIVLTNPVLPIKLVWASSVFLLVGGGRYAAEMLLAAMIAKACTEDTREHSALKIPEGKAYFYRTRGLYYFYSRFVFGELVGPPVASVAADISPWLPFFISYFLLLLTFPLLLVMPKDYITTSSVTIDSTEDLPTSHDQGHSTLQAVLRASFDQIHLLRFILSSRNMCLAAVIFLICTFRGISLRALVQYVSSRFDWKLSRTNALISEVAFVNLVLFFFIMPALLLIISKYLKPTPQVLNLGIVMTSLSLLFLGSILHGFSTNSAFLIAATMIYGLGLGFGARSTLLSLVTSWIDPQRAGTLFSAVFLVEQIGMLGGEPLVQNLLGISLGLQDPWQGLPFICTAVFYLISIACMFSIKTQPE